MSATDERRATGTLFAASSRRLRRAHDWFRGHSAALLVLALLVGAGAGLGAVGFRSLITWCTELFAGNADAAHLRGAANPLVPELGTYFLLLAPVVGGLIYGPLISHFAREARGHGVPEVMLAVAEQSGRIRPRVVLIKALASALCIGAGGSVGREGPIVQIGAALGSSLGQGVRVPTERLRLLAACGAAGGIAATFNAPIAGVFFALEIILADFDSQSIGVVVVSSVAASVIGRSFFGAHPFFALPEFGLHSVREYVLFAILGVLAAVAGVLFTKVLYGTEDVVDRLWRGPEALRPAVGGLALGLLLFFLPELYGVGYPALHNAIVGQYAIGLMLLLFAGKILATSLSIGIGGSGGIFAPCLFAGSMLGGTFGQLAHELWPNITGSATGYAIVGMGALFAAAARAPVTAILIIFELTGDYAIILPLMFAVAVATGVSSLLSRDTIYTLKLRRRGVDLEREHAPSLLQVLRVRDAMGPLPELLPHDLSLEEAVHRFSPDGPSALPVVDHDGAYRGLLRIEDLQTALHSHVGRITPMDLAQPTPSLAPDETLQHALLDLGRRGGSGLPVFDPEGERVVGWLTVRDVLAAYRDRFEQTVAEAEKGDEHEEPAPEPASPLAHRLGDYRILHLEVVRHEVDGASIADVDWPPATVVIAVRRGAETFEPSQSSVVLRLGDRLTVLTHVDRLAEVSVCV